MLNNFEILRENIDILELVQKETGFSAKRVGGDTYRLEKCPSCDSNNGFTIRPERRYFKCFCGCYDGRAGDVTTFISKYRNMTVADSMKYLSDTYHVTLKTASKKEKEQNEKFKNRQLLLIEAIDYYSEVLMNNPDALKFQLDEKKHEKETLEKFRVGLSDGKLTEHLRKQGYSVKELIGSGLVKIMGSKPVDYWVEGLFIYPHFMSGNKIGNLSAKKFNNNDYSGYQFPKPFRYYNYLFYNHSDIAKKNIIIVEGENDLLSVIEALNDSEFFKKDEREKNKILREIKLLDKKLEKLDKDNDKKEYEEISKLKDVFETNIENLKVGDLIDWGVIAINGQLSGEIAKYGDDQLSRIRKLEKRNLYLWFDDDFKLEKKTGKNPGINCTNKIIDAGVNCRVISNEKYKDPHDQLKIGKGSLQNLIKEALPHIEYKIFQIDEESILKGDIFMPILELMKGEDEITCNYYVHKVMKEHFRNWHHTTGKAVFRTIERIKRRAKEQKKFRIADEKNDLKLNINDLIHTSTKLISRQQKEEDISSIIIKDLEKEFNFFRTEEEAFFVFDRERHHLIEYVPDNKDYIFQAFINKRYGLNASLGYYKYLKVNVLTKFYEADEIEVRNNFYFDEDKNVIYIFNNNNLIIKVAKDKVEIIGNGDDGIFFNENNNKVIDVDVEQIDKIREDYCYFRDGLTIEKYNEKKSILIESLLNKLHISEENILDDVSLRMIILVYIYALFFESMLPTKPLLTFIGEKESGKSFFNRILGKIIFGENFDVRTVRKEEDLMTAISNNIYVALDNVDKYHDWLNDSLASAATGMILTKRSLFSNNKEVSYKVKCFLSLSSRSPKFNRDDVSSRTLIVRLDTIEKKIPEGLLTKNILNNRSLIFSEIIINLQEILNLLHDQKGLELEFTNRIADFALFFVKVMNENQGGDVTPIEILKKIHKEQYQFTLSDNPIFTSLEMFFDNQHNERLTQIISGNSSEIYNKLCDNERIEKILMRYCKNYASFGQKLNNILPELKQMFEIKRSIGRANKKEYKIERIPF